MKQEPLVVHYRVTIERLYASDLDLEAQRAGVANYLEGTAPLPFVVDAPDGDGDSVRCGRFATREAAESLAAEFRACSDWALVVVEG